jgi:hypothetical protein
LVDYTSCESNLRLLRARKLSHLNRSTALSPIPYPLLQLLTSDFRRRSIIFVLVVASPLQLKPPLIMRLPRKYYLARSIYLMADSLTAIKIVQERMP